MTDIRDEVAAALDLHWMEETSKGVLSQPVTNPTALAFLYPETKAVA